MTTEATTERALLPNPGDIHRAYITWHLITGDFATTEREILILDAEHIEDGARIVWTPMAGHGSDWLPTMSVQQTDFPLMEWPAGAVLWRESRLTRSYRLSLSERLTSYKPRDPKYNSLDMLQRSARESLQARPSAESIRKWLREVTDRLASLPAERDELIRLGLAERIPAAELAELAGVSPGRIYQIRDGRR